MKYVAAVDFGSTFTKVVAPDLRNHFADISKAVHETGEPLFLTKNGYGDMVGLSMEAFEKLYFLKARSVLNCRRLSGKPS